MNREEYIAEVDRVLEAHKENAASNLVAALALIPSEATRVTLDIFVDQDGEGCLDVRMGLDGPNLSVLARAISPHAQLFQTMMSENGLDPDLPLMGPRDQSFSVHDTLTDCAAQWIIAIWGQLDAHGIHLPVVVQSPDGYGATTPFQLNS